MGAVTCYSSSLQDGGNNDMRELSGVDHRQGNESQRSVLPWAPLRLLCLPGESPKRSCLHKGLSTQRRTVFTATSATRSSLCPDVPSARTLSHQTASAPWTSLGTQSVLSALAVLLSSQHRWATGRERESRIATIVTQTLSCPSVEDVVNLSQTGHSGLSTSNGTSSVLSVRNARRHLRARKTSIQSITSQFADHALESMRMNDHNYKNTKIFKNTKQISDYFLFCLVSNLKLDSRQIQHWRYWYLSC